MGSRLNSFMYALAAIVFAMILANCAENRGFRAHKTNEQDLIQAAKLKRLGAGRDGAKAPATTGSKSAPGIPGAGSQSATQPRASGAPAAPAPRQLTDADRLAAEQLRLAQERQRQQTQQQQQQKPEAVTPNPKLAELAQVLSINTEENNKFHKETITGLTVVKNESSSENRLNLGVDVLVSRGEKEEIHAATGVLVPGDKISEGKLVKINVLAAIATKPAYQDNLASEGVEIYAACATENCTEVQVLVMVTVGEKKAGIITLYKIGEDGKFALFGAFPHGANNLKAVNIAQARSENLQASAAADTAAPATSAASDAAATLTTPATTAASQRQRTSGGTSDRRQGSGAVAPSEKSGKAVKAPMLIIEKTPSFSDGVNNSAPTGKSSDLNSGADFRSGLSGTSGSDSSSTNLFPDLSEAASGSATRSATIDLGTGSPITLDVPVATAQPAAAASTTSSGSTASTASSNAASTGSTYGKAAATANNERFRASEQTQSAVQQNRADRRAGRERIQQMRNQRQEAAPRLFDLIGK